MLFLQGNDAKDSILKFDSRLGEPICEALTNPTGVEELC